MIGIQFWLGMPSTPTDTIVQVAGRGHRNLTPSDTTELREGGIYTLDGAWLIAKKRSVDLYFLFSQRNWDCLGPVDYRLSHGMIFQHGLLTDWTAADLIDTGRTANPPLFSPKH